jgi:nucleotide-binding universal stress UspA family protein
MILIAYDGSDDAKSAIEHPGSLLSDQPAIVVTVWESYGQIRIRYPAPGALLAGVNMAQIDEASREAADDMAEEDAALARAHGLSAPSRAVARGDSIAETLLAEADRSNAGAIVVGSRGLGGLGLLLLGSVSYALLQPADRPVVIVPSPNVARKRNDRRRVLDEAHA